ncbi:hypothetical protein [Gimesia sp.]|uniref:hypothetical protein n=1 Tax=Gimesia sp. TaxID=2024833 RepID=UPI003A8F7FD8
MPENKSIEVKKLKLDLNNFRTVTQKNEASAINSMIALKPNKFWALMESLLDDGFHPTENIIVLKSGRSLIVKEGNRRIASLKLILGYVEDSDNLLPDSINESINELAREWKSINKRVPCVIYDSSEENEVDKIITLAHGKGEKAGRDIWNGVARARHNRDKNGGSEPALDLLEKYLEIGKTLSRDQAERWGGDYPITVLEEAINKLATRCGVNTSKELATKYPKIKFRRNLEMVMQDIGLKRLKFPDIRAKTTEFGEHKYKFPALPIPNATSSNTSGTGGNKSGTKKTKTTTKTSTNKKSGKIVAKPINTEKALKDTLNAFTPIGPNRQKVATLLAEAISLRLTKHPIAFCFLLRSMFEISAKAYCDDHKTSGGPRLTKTNGMERPLKDLLRDIAKHLTKNNTDQGMKKALHGAITELNTPEGFLSVTSMNQLVHSPTFTINESHICTVFSNIFPLLEAMNT